MKILKFKKISSNKYKVHLDDNSSLNLYEDVIINNNLLIKKEIEEEKLEDILKENNNMHLYEVCLNYISIRMRSEKEINNYLIKKGASKEKIDEVIKKLKKNGYINDFDFARAYVKDQMLLTPNGPYKIKNGLYKHDIKEDVINEVIEEIDNGILKEKLSNLMEKQLRIKKGSSKMLKMKLVNYFSNLGYDKEIILDVISNYSIKTDIDKLKKEYQKLRLKYEKKYTGSELDYVINNKLYQKGYTIEEIKKVSNY